MELIKLAFGTDEGMILLRSSFMNQILPTTGLWPEMLPTSTRMTKVRVMRKHKEASKANIKRVRVARLMVDLEGEMP